MPVWTGSNRIMPQASNHQLATALGASTFRVLVPPFVLSVFLLWSLQGYYCHVVGCLCGTRQHTFRPTRDSLRLSDVADVGILQIPN
jgi:hypothetical protein